MTRTLVTVAEVDPFGATAASAGVTKDERQKITVFSAESPRAGDVIPRAGGLRKLRWAAKGKGERGGHPVIYCYSKQTIQVYLLAVYLKSQQIDPTPQQKDAIDRSREYDEGRGN